MEAGYQLLQHLQEDSAERFRFVYLVHWVHPAIHGRTGGQIRW